MNDSYDEDLSRNPFFLELRNEHGDVFRHAVASGWVLCVPRASRLRVKPQRADALAHVLAPDDELPGARYFSLAGQSLNVADGFITVETTRPGIRIIFEETFYTEDDVKYKVWCIDHPLNRPGEFKSKADLYFVLSSLKDCVDFLWTESDGREVLENLDVLIRLFKDLQINQKCYVMNELRDKVGELYANCIRCAFNNKKLNESSEADPNFKRNVKLAVETYMHYGIHDELFDAIVTCVAREDADLNKITRNLSGYRLRDLEIGGEFVPCIPLAKMCLSQIVTFRTVLGKTVCLKKTISAITKKKQKTDEYLSLDELLPIIIFLLIKSGLPNWHAQLNFMKHFRFADSSAQFDETSYALSTLEAVIEHLKSGALDESSNYRANDPVADCDNMEMVTYKNKFKPERSVISRDDDSLDNLFKQVELSNYDFVKEILTKNHPKVDNECNFNADLNGSVSIEEILREDLDDFSNLCHPLCTCTKCCNILSKNVTTVPSVFSRDDRGLTLLHAACIHNKPQMADLMLELGADVDTVDCNGFSPLHYAASKGHQTTLLLLLHAYADVNKENLEKNSPMHLAANNGHDSCVKAIIYFAENSKIKINLNAKNDNGDTPLHLASKWGYETIAKILSEYGADPWQQNNKGKSPIDVAHSSIMLKLLHTNGVCLNEYVNVINVCDNTAKIVDYDDKKSNTTLLKFPDDPEREFKAKNVIVKPRSIHRIKQIERLFRAITYGDVKLACFYMGIDINVTDRVDSADKQKYCHPLCVCEKCEILPKISVSKFDMDICDSNGNTTLHTAAQYGHIEICNVLLGNNASTDVQNAYGHSPLHVAIREKQTAIGKMLIKRGADLELKDFKGNTPLHLACIMGNAEIVKSILSRGCFSQTHNSAGKTPLDEAKDKIFLTIMALFDDIGIS